MRAGISTDQRVAHFEGLRGIAAFAVVLCHYYSLYYLPLDSNANRVVIHSPVMVALYGKLDVSVFFVLSGYVLTAKYFGTKDRAIILNMAAARYPRLAIPALVSFVIAYAVATMGWFSQYLAKMQILSSLGFGPEAWWKPSVPMRAVIYEGLSAYFSMPMKALA